MKLKILLCHGLILLFYFSVECQGKKIVKIIVPKKIKYVHHTHVVLVKDKVKKRPPKSDYHQHHFHHHEDDGHHYHHHRRHKKRPYHHHEHYHQPYDESEEYSETTLGVPVYKHPTKIGSIDNSKDHYYAKSKYKHYPVEDDEDYMQETSYKYHEPIPYSSVKTPTYNTNKKYKPMPVTTHHDSDGVYSVLDINKWEPLDLEDYEESADSSFGDQLTFSEDMGYSKVKMKPKWKYSMKDYFHPMEATTHIPIYNSYGSKLDFEKPLKYGSNEFYPYDDFYLSKTDWYDSDSINQGKPSSVLTMLPSTDQYSTLNNQEFFDASNIENSYFPSYEIMKDVPRTNLENYKTI